MKKGQIWVETVIYTLIAFIMIAAVLFFVKPKIQELQDQTVLDQSVEIMKYLDSLINEVGQQCAGNKREFELGLEKGTLTIKPSSEEIIFEIESTYEYSESGIEVNDGKVIILTEKNGEDIDVSLKINYTNYDLKFNSQETEKVLSASSTPYQFYISNEGGSPKVINLEVE